MFFQSTHSNGFFEHLPSEPEHVAALQLQRCVVSRQRIEKARQICSKNKVTHRVSKEQSNTFVMRALNKPLMHKSYSYMSTFIKRHFIAIKKSTTKKSRFISYKGHTET